MKKPYFNDNWKGNTIMTDDPRRYVCLKDGRRGHVARRALNAPMLLIEWDDETLWKFGELNNYQRLAWIENEHIMNTHAEGNA